MTIQIFGVKNDSATRKALRFFQERRIQVHFVDFKVKGPSKGELTRFVQKFGGAEALIDRDSKRFRSLGLGTACYGDERWLEIAVDEPMILRMPLVRNQKQLTVGPAEVDWKDWIRR
jgi:arsenate reductase-like glutaredoxin family protein